MKDMEENLNMSLVEYEQSNADLGTILLMIQRNEILLNEENEHLKLKWKTSQKVDYIETLLMGIPQSFIFCETNRNQLIVLDGYSKLKTLKDFYYNQLQLKKLKWLSQYNGCFHKDLPLSIIHRISRVGASFYIIKRNTPAKEKLAVSQTINDLYFNGLTEKKFEEYYNSNN